MILFVYCLVGLDLHIQIIESVSSLIRTFSLKFFCALSAVIAAPDDGKKHEQKDDALPDEIKLPVKHVLSRELRVYHMLYSLFSIYF